MNMRGGRVKFVQTLFQCRKRCRASQVGFGQDQAVGHCRLLGRLEVTVQLCFAQHGIDGGDDAIHAKSCPYPWVIQQGVEDGRGVGNAGGFDDDALKFWNVAALPRHVEIF